MAIAKSLAYLRVLADEDVACATLNERLIEYIDSSYMAGEINTDFPGGEVITVETIWALNHILSIDLYAESYFVEFIMEQCERFNVEGDALHLIEKEKV
jgi:hypothetical protein